MTGTTKAAGSAVILDPTGLHARPAVKLTKTAKGFAADIRLRAGDDGAWTNAKSPNAVMKMKAGHGATLHIEAEGDDAEAAVHEIVGLIEREFTG